jgi:acyl carrier protein
MNPRQVILDAIERIAPDVDASAVPDDVDFREEAELDSMDFLSVLNAIQEATGVEVPEIDYAQIMTIAQFTDYLNARIQSSG